MGKTTHSNVKKVERDHYEVQRKTKSGKWVPLRPPRQFACGNHGFGLKFLRDWIWSLEHGYFSKRKLGRLRVVKVRTVQTEQKFYTPTDLKARK